MVSPSGIPEINQAATAYLQHNKAIRTLGARGSSVIDRTLTTPPASPGVTDIYIPATVATDEWVGQENTLARFEDNIWVFYTPFNNQVIYSDGDNSFIQYDGTNWNTIGSSGGGGGGLTADTTYYVDPAGNDTNNGLTPGTAFQTIQKAVDVVSSLSSTSFVVDIQLADGTYDTQTPIILGDHSVATPVVIKGNNTDNTLVILDDSNVTSSLRTVLIQTANKWNFQDLTLTNTAASTGGGNYCINLTLGATTELEDCRLLGGANTRGIFAENGSAFRVINSLDIENNFVFIFVIDNLSIVNIAGRTVTFTSVTVGSAYMLILANSVYNQRNTTFVNNVTGTRYDARGNSTLRTDNAQDSDVPGSVAGILATGSVFFS